MTIAPAPRCPDCGEAWDESDRCPKCGVDRAEIDALLTAACREYAAARAAADEGRITEARQYLRAARVSGLRHDAVDRLDALCAAISGVWDGLCAESLPASWQEAVASPTVAADYQEARQAAAREDWQTALAAAERCVTGAPWLLPAQKVRILSLCGAGRLADAAQVCRELLAEFPAEPDLLRYSLEWAAPLSSAAPEAAEPAPPQRVETAPRREGRRPVLRQVAWGGMGLAAGLALGFVIGPLRSQMPSSPSESTRVATVPPYTGAEQSSEPMRKTAPAPIAPEHPAPTETALPPSSLLRTLPTVLRHEAEQARRQAEFQQARRWFNDAVRAQATGDWRMAERKAAAAFTLGKDSYLGDDALLLRAQAAERGERSEAAGWYAGIAEWYPHSPYAPIGLLQAARVAHRRERQEEATLYARRLRKAYPESREARRAGRWLRPEEDGAR